MTYEYWFIEYEGGETTSKWMTAVDWALDEWLYPIVSAVKLREVEQ